MLELLSLFPFLKGKCLNNEINVSLQKFKRIFLIFCNEKGVNGSSVNSWGIMQKKADNLNFFFFAKLLIEGVGLIFW